MAVVYPRLGTELARTPEVHAELQLLADKIATEVRARAGGHVRTGHYESSIEVLVDEASPSRGDRLVVATDDNAVSIEYGHVAAMRGRHGPPRHVPGLHIMTDVAGTARL